MGDAVDIERPDELAAYLRRSGRVGAGECVKIEVLAGGVSNKTVRVERESGEAWVLKQALPKLRVAVDWFSDPARIGREAEGLRWLNEAVPGCTPLLVFEDPEQHLLGMEAVPRPHKNWKQMLLTEEVGIELPGEFARLLALIHRRGYEQREQTSVRFTDRSFFESLRIEPYYLYTASREPAAAAFLNELVDSTRGRRITVVHGDYSPKNILVRGEVEMVLLDHEVIHFGDPAFDLGFAMTHLLSKANHRDPAEDLMLLGAASGMWNGYRGDMKGVPWIDELQPHVIRHTLGCLLARVSGRSPLEYLTAEQRQWQREGVLTLMEARLRNVKEMVDGFNNLVLRQKWLKWL